MSSVPQHLQHLTSADFAADGAFRPSMLVGGMDRFVGNALHRWEIDGATVSH